MTALAPMTALGILLVLFVACGMVVFAYQRLLGVSDRLKELQDDLARNDEQLRRHVTRLQAIEEAARQDAAAATEANAAAANGTLENGASSENDEVSPRREPIEPARSDEKEAT